MIINWLTKLWSALGSSPVCAREEKISTLGLGKSQNQVSINYWELTHGSFFGLISGFHTDSSRID